jgi:hypothetical protein
MAQRPATLTKLNRGIRDRSAFLLQSRLGKNGAQMSAQKYFPKIHQWQLRQTAFWISA